MKADLIAYACYEISYPADAAPVLAQYNALESVPVEKKSKRKTKTVELKEYVPALELHEAGEWVHFPICLPASQDLTLNPSLLVAFLEEKIRPACGKRQHPAHEILDGGQESVCVKIFLDFLFKSLAFTRVL